MVEWTIYCHTHIESSRRYIGLTKQTMEKRWWKHVSEAKRLRGRGCAHFWNAILKYGEDAFFHQVLEVCNSLEAANEAEAAWIESFSSRDPQFGFNLMRGGEQRLHPEKKNPWLSPGFRERVTASVAAAAARPESQLLRSRTSKALWSDPSFREKNLSATLATRKDPKVRQTISDGIRKRFEDPSQRAALSKLWDDPDFRARCSVGLTNGKNKNKTHCSNGHEFTPETSFIDTQGYRRCDICRQNRNERRRQTRSSL